MAWQDFINTPSINNVTNNHQWNQCSPAAITAPGRGRAIDEAHLKDLGWPKLGIVLIIEEVTSVTSGGRRGGLKGW